MEPTTNVSRKSFQQTDDAQQLMGYIRQLQNDLISISKDNFGLSSQLANLEARVKSLESGG